MSRWLLAVAFGLGAAFVASALGPLGGHTLELKTYDARLRRVATGAGDQPPISLVLIDDHSIRRLEPVAGRWPWPRVIHSLLVDFLARGPAKVVAYDVLFSEADKGTTDILGTTWTGEESDAALVESVRRAGNVIFAVEASSEGLEDASKNVQPPLDAVASLDRHWPVDGFAERRPLLTPPFADLARAARGVGHARLAYDADGPARRYIPFVEVAGHTVPSLPVAAALAARDIGPDQASATREALQLGALRVPWVEQVVPDFYGPAQTVFRPLVPFRGPTLRADRTPTFRSYSFQDLILAEQQILDGQPPAVDPAVFRDQIVVVGVSAEGLKDTFTTPFREGQMAGAEFHANVIDAILSGRSIAPASRLQRATVTTVPALAVGLVGAIGTPWLTASAAALVSITIVWYTTHALANGVWLPLVAPLVAAGLAFVADLAWMYFVEGREKRRVKRIFSRYVSKDVYQQLMASPTDAVLGGQRRQMTVLFSDMRGFTTLSEQGQAEDLVRQLNQYFTRMVDVVFAHRGTVDKFVGDMVMALYGAPLPDADHADHAVQTALAMVAALHDLNRQWLADGRSSLDIGIGINSGEMIAGNIGSDTIMSYTVIGDNVNLGARLESLNKDYGTRILISDATRRLLRGSYDIRPLGEVTVKGKTRAVVIFEVRAGLPSEVTT
jgi:adenylate cyclase